MNDITDYERVQRDMAEACPPWGAELLVAAVALVATIAASALGVWA